MPSSQVTFRERPPCDEHGRILLRLEGHHDAAEVRLLHEVRRPRDEPVLHHVERGWWVRFDPGPVDRLEYRFVLRYADGHQRIIIDPHNPDVVGNPFGDRSLWTRDDYREPDWLQHAPARHGVRTLTSVRSRRLHTDVPVRLWAHPQLHGHDVAPLVVVHDGRAFADEARLGRYLDHLAADSRLRPFRAALVDSDDRNRRYSADPEYVEALADDVLPRLADGSGLAPADAIVGVGASLGALAHLHMAHRRPGTYTGLFLMSTSFFRPLVDGVESGFPWFDRITAFSDEIVTHGPAGSPLPVTLTCGLVEENLANNKELAAVLRTADWPVETVGHRDAHTMPSWRDVLEPHLRSSLVRMLSA